MPAIIQQHTTSCNNYFNQKAACTRNLPKLCRKILQIYYEDRLAGLEYSDRSLKELANRFKVTTQHISRCLSHLHKERCLNGLKHGSGYKKRWITFEAFCELEEKLSSQNTTQNLAIPYIDLFSDKEDQDTKKQLDCSEIDHPLLLERLNLILEKTWHHENDRTIVKSAINRSDLSLVSKLSLVARVGRGMITNPIRYKRAYFLKSLQNEERRL